MNNGQVLLVAVVGVRQDHLRGIKLRFQLKRDLARALDAEKEDNVVTVRLLAIACSSFLS